MLEITCDRCFKSKLYETFYFPKHDWYRIADQFPPIYGNVFKSVDMYIVCSACKDEIKSGWSDNLEKTLISALGTQRSSHPNPYVENTKTPLQLFTDWLRGHWRASK